MNSLDAMDRALANWDRMVSPEWRDDRDEDITDEETEEDFDE